MAVQVVAAGAAMLGRLLASAGVRNVAVGASRSIARGLVQRRRQAALSRISDRQQRYIDRGQSPEEQEARQRKILDINAKVDESFGKLFTSATGAAGALLTMPKAVQKFSDALLRSQQGLVAVNPIVANSMARLEADRLRRSIESGRRRGPSIRRLAESQSNLEKALQPIADAMATVMNNMMTVVNNLATVGVSAFQASMFQSRGQAEFAKRFFEFFGKDFEEEAKKAAAEKNGWDKFADDRASAYKRNVEEYEDGQRNKQWRL